MTAKLIDGRAIARRIEGELAAEVERLRGALAAVTLVSIDAGENAVAALFQRGQERAALRAGMRFVRRSLPAGAREEELLALVRAQNGDPAVHGVIVQRPLPEGMDTRRVLDAVLPEKDVEGMHPANLGRTLRGETGLLPCTARAAVDLLLGTGCEPRGLEVVVIGHSEIAGKPIALLLLDRLATVTVCHIGTRDLARHTRGADAVLVAAGKPNLVTGDMLKPGAVVIDIGINQVADAKAPGGTRIVGDVDFESARRVAGWITPVPGGVGPVTVAMLLANTVAAARRQHGV
ncbi:MAG: bifunctional 5,10-methylenetetrahydrofolate dehydrogenase/5,10-methenyltetrahydrofolate cyclohydrolase [Planctomycetes bacterium]|nr:bifunctional 5,10-methylenetetrahydrofolate dehydrogenase/5,10-methenyltetrahydrofolate cyclohydrolase [Planctomycetota bacterium]